ncbi:MAG: DUF192 domain-containing protein [Bdellovibrionaceae bacterium]|nr:DUF192 domain-containing protein [Pseudobdellovibrionaceae bacterium]
MKLINQKNSKVLSTKVHMARSFKSRLKGLMFSNPLAHGHCLWISQCKSVHSCFMKFTLDILFVDKKLRVIKIIKALKPWRITFFYIKADSVMEFNAGELNNIKVGDQLLLQK